MRVLIVQPWFTAIGHPAQSVLNSARVLGKRPDVGYLISNPGRGEFSATANELDKFGPVERFNSRGDSLRTGTVLSLPSILRLAWKNADLEQVLFLDAHLAVLAAAWPLVAVGARRVRYVGTVHLGGPESIASRAVTRMLVAKFLSCPGRRLFLRTDELAQAWRAAFPGLPRERIDTIPSLEIAGAADVIPPSAAVKRLRFGVIGQVRPGKSLEWLVPMFQNDGQIGILNVAGAFTNADHRERLAFLPGYANFDNRFLSERDMLVSAGNQDYLLALYDDWDARMEAATIYLAARVGRPVIVYDEGWAGRMVREFGCGIAVVRNPRPDPDFFRRLPRPGENSYQALLDGTARFRNAHTGAGVRDAFLAKLFKP